MIKFIFSFLFLFSFFIHAESVLNTEANALLLYRNSKSGGVDFDPANVNPTPNGFNLQEMELRFFSEVDSGTKLDIVFALAPEYESAGTQVSEKWVWEPEILNVVSTVVPNFTFKAGKFKADLGDHNLLHTHQFPFVEAPLINTQLLGEHGLNDFGLSTTYKVPTSWTNEITVQYLRGQGENDSFKSPSPGGGVGLVNWNNFFESNDTFSVELGLSYASGGNSYRKTTSLQGVDVTLGWYPSKGNDVGSIEWTTEFLRRIRSQENVSDENGSGLSSYVIYQLNKDWGVSYRFENLTMKESFDAVKIPNLTQERNTVGLTLSPTPHQSYKFEFIQHAGLTNEKETTIHIQGNVTISSHH